jgi:hypothetical protein
MATGSGGLGMSDAMCPPYDVPWAGVRIMGVACVVLLVVLAVIVVWIWRHPPPPDGPMGPNPL